MDDELRQLLASAEQTPEALSQAATSALRAGDWESAGWLIRAGLIAGHPLGEALDASAPPLEAYAQEDLREFPFDDLAPPPACWLPDGRLACGGVNTHKLYAWDLASGEHSVLHERAELGEEDDGPWWIEHSRIERVSVGPRGAQVVLSYGEDLPKGGNAVAEIHWVGKPLAGGPAEDLGHHGTHHAAGAAGDELLGLDSWHDRGELSGWTPGTEVQRGEPRLTGAELLLAPGTCLVRHGTERLGFYSADGRELLSEAVFPGTLTQRYAGVRAAWAGRALVRGADKRSLILFERGQELARAALPEELPLDGWWVHSPHPSGRITLLTFSGEEFFALFDLRSGELRRFELPKYYSSPRVLWSPGGALALMERKGLILLRPR